MNGSKVCQNIIKGFDGFAKENGIGSAFSNFDVAEASAILWGTGDGVRHEPPSGLITPTEIRQNSAGGLRRVNYVWISLGAVVGASARYFLSGYVARHVSLTFPYGTLIINVTGSLILGFFLIFSTERVLLDPRWRLLVAIGFCGSYTTFSSYAFESFALLEQSQWLMFGINVVASNVLCLAAVLAGAVIAKGL